MVGQPFQTPPAIGTPPENIKQLNALTDNELLALAGEYPYVALYKVVLARRYKKEGDEAYREILRRAALQVPDRVRLYELLHHEETVPAGLAAVEELVQETAERPAAPRVESDRAEVAVPKKEEEEPAADQAPEYGTAEPEDIQDTTVSDAPVIEEPVQESTAADDQEIQPQGETDQDALLRVAARREVSLDEKHTFLEWLELLEGGAGEAAVSGPAEPLLPEISDEDAVDILEDQIDEYSAARQYEADIQREVSDMEAHDLEAEIDPDDSAAVKDLADKSIALRTGVVTETLAKLMLMQGKKSEAIAMYEQLRLKYPEKSDYFAAQITAIQTS